MLKQATSHKPHLAFKGFTLSELLVSLAVLGLIAGLTVPSIVASVEKSKNKAIAKELYQLISDVVSNGVMNGDFASMSTLGFQNSTDPVVQYLTSKFNAIQCPKNTYTSPCNHNFQGRGVADAYNNSSGRWAFPNGSKIKLNEYFGNPLSLFEIDTQPNHTNEMGNTNQAPIVCNITDTIQTTYLFTMPVKPGQCLPYPDSRSGNLGLL